MEDRYLVSVIIPTYKGTDNLERAITSITNNEYRNIEIIVVDDNGKNTTESYATKDIIKKINDPRIKYVCHEKNKNGAVARNTGVNNSKGDYITFLDDDDYMLPKRILNSLNMIEKAELLFCDVCDVRYGVDYRICRVNDNLSPEYMLLNEMAIGTGSNIFITRRLYKELDGFNETYTRFQDREFIIRALQKSKPKIIHEVLLIKSKNKQNNQPSFAKRLEIENIFHSDFDNLFEKLTKEQICGYRNAVEHKHLEILILSGNKDKAYEVANIIKYDDSLKAYEFLSLCLFKLGFKINGSVMSMIRYSFARIRNIKEKRRIKKDRFLWEFIKSNEEKNYGSSRNYTS
ncbi:glycosyltransferase family 2 protein [Butyrivibrio sp. YAB3001]|uniref:glycosyltransferase family 2 protein n=1 Tax=Butyrivibrio sp. YAB3001 TaxID=1520812 RepID=UPI000B866512|nr:glycosyltransferase family 2 protein [Butyrivibrio sp. YAB3001]